VKTHAGLMSRMTTFSASFSVARAAIRRACSRELRALSVAGKRGLHDPR
jgi:hypothetical protein